MKDMSRILKSPMRLRDGGELRMSHGGDMRLNPGGRRMYVRGDLRMNDGGDLQMNYGGDLQMKYGGALCMNAGGDLRTGQGGHVPGSGSGDKIPAKYEPGEFVVSNDMLDAAPQLREQLHGLRTDVLAAKGMTPEQADAKAMGGAGLRAARGFTAEEFNDRVGGLLAEKKNTQLQTAGLAPMTTTSAPTNAMGQAFSAARTNSPTGWAPSTPAPASKAPDFRFADGPMRSNLINYNTAPEITPLNVTTSAGAAPNPTAAPRTSDIAGRMQGAGMESANNAMLRGAQERAANMAVEAQTRAANPSSMTTKQLFSQPAYVPPGGVSKGPMPFAAPTPRTAGPVLSDASAQALSKISRGAPGYNATPSAVPPVVPPVAPIVPPAGAPPVTPTGAPPVTPPVTPPATPAAPPVSVLRGAANSVGSAASTAAGKAGEVLRGATSSAGSTMSRMGDSMARMKYDATQIAKNNVGPLALAAGAIPGQMNVGEVLADSRSSGIDVATQQAYEAGRLGAQSAGATLGGYVGAGLGIPTGPFALATGIAGGAFGGYVGGKAYDMFKGSADKLLGNDPRTPLERLRATPVDQYTYSPGDATMPGALPRPNDDDERVNKYLALSGAGEVSQLTTDGVRNFSNLRANPYDNGIRAGAPSVVDQQALAARGLRDQAEAGLQKGYADDDRSRRAEAERNAQGSRTLDTSSIDAQIANTGSLNAKKILVDQRESMVRSFGAQQQNATALQGQGVTERGNVMQNEASISNNRATNMLGMYNAQREQGNSNRTYELAKDKQVNELAATEADRAKKMFDKTQFRLNEKGEPVEDLAAQEASHKAYLNMTDGKVLTEPQRLTVEADAKRHGTLVAGMRQKMQEKNDGMFNTIFGKDAMPTDIAPNAQLSEVGMLRGAFTGHRVNGGDYEIGDQMLPADIDDDVRKYQLRRNQAYAAQQAQLNKGK